MQSTDAPTPSAMAAALPLCVCSAVQLFEYSLGLLLMLCPVTVAAVLGITIAASEIADLKGVPSLAGVWAGNAFVNADASPYAIESADKRL